MTCGGATTQQASLYPAQYGRFNFRRINFFILKEISPSPKKNIFFCYRWFV